MKEFKKVNQLRIMEKILPFILFLSILITPVIADTFNYCQDNVTLVKISTTTINVPELEITRTLNTSENITCSYGCDMSLNECSMSETMIYLIVGGCFVVLIILVILLRKARVL